jgi:peptidylprolyl isomerase
MYLLRQTFNPTGGFCKGILILISLLNTVTYYLPIDSIIMKQAQAGDTVQVHYTGTLPDGQLFDSSAGREPLSFQLGSGQVIKGFDDGVTGMAVGDKKTVHIPNEEAYGPVNEDMIVNFERNQIPADIPLEVGITLNMHQDGNGQVIPVIVKEVSDEFVVLDANHPLAGQDLIFELELVGIE